MQHCEAEFITDSASFFFRGACVKRGFECVAGILPARIAATLSAKRGHSESLPEGVFDLLSE